jgi:hypothetical protein
MPTTDEKNILKILEEEGGELGELREVKISRYMGLRLDYLRSILDSMGRRNLIDVFTNGKVNIADRGWRALGKNPPSPWGGLAGVQESKAELPEDKYKRWMSGEPEEEPKQERSSKERDESQPFEYDSYADLPPEERLEKWVSK